MGKNVRDFQIGDRVVADVGISVRHFFLTSDPRFLTVPSFLQCDYCFYCRRGEPVLCEDFNARGVTSDGGFAEYIV